jgi:hypothetical protein
MDGFPIAFTKAAKAPPSDTAQVRAGDGMVVVHTGARNRMVVHFFTGKDKAVMEFLGTDQEWRDVFQWICKGAMADLVTISVAVVEKY